MKLNITAKLFIAIFVTSLVVAIALGGAARVSFMRGFVGYLNEEGMRRAETVLPALTEAYRRNGDWNFLRGNTRGWFQLLRPRPPEVPRTNNGFPAVDPAGEPDLTGVHLRITLLDADKRYVAGQPDIRGDALMSPVIVDGRTVGWLSLMPFERVTGEANERFERRQLRATLVIGVLAALLAAGVAFWLTRTLTRPIKAIASSTRQLANGNYATRVPITTRDEIGRLSQDFNQLALTLERTEQMRRVFVADVSHELRTPLAILKGEIEALEDGVRPLTREAIRSLQTEVSTLNKLVSDLYDLSLSDVGALSYRKTEVDLGDIVRSSIDSFRERLAQRSLALAVDLPEDEVILSADDGRLRQLMHNLLENAVRYTDAGGQLRITCRVEQELAIVRIEDSTPGVPDDVLPRLFDRFYRVDASRNRESGGAGLGLAICRNIVEAHGGTITASSSTLGGITMTVRLPLAAKV